MFGINGGEMIVLIVIALVVIGPHRLPEYAEKLKNLVRQLKRMAEGAKAQVKEDLGEDFDDVDWKKLDPRQYDPRRIVREALQEETDSLKTALDSDDSAKPTNKSAATGSTAAGATGSAAASAAGSAAASTAPGAATSGSGSASTDAAAEKAPTRLTAPQRAAEQASRREAGQPAPFDAEAT
ncbi:twin-arginine translocase TatA/TatE family subunit [Saxibacter everestensis]|uniref:Sec-independent protein translocase protein TatB n=1 Tax=Saxibacter everestensis TaxID=2909229 RepID=A0ABY8QQV9_9MICO|nr:twin-arginine translocase TatA/TatE family subunit [Brevibacteriaceae bacterium ZFBP1038]